MQGRLAWLAPLMLAGAITAPGIGGETTPQSDPASPTAREDPAGQPGVGRWRGRPSFEANVGQAPTGVDFVGRVNGSVVLLQAGDAVVSIPDRRRQPDVVTLRFIGTNRLATPTGMDPLSGVVNYFVGRESGAWQTGIQTYGSVRYVDLYRGIDVVYKGPTGRLQYDLILDPWADPRAVRLRVGPGRARLDEVGNLVVGGSGGQTRFARPFGYQMVSGQRRPVSTEYVLSRDGTISLAVGPYDQSRKLIIDPVLEYSSYLGGSLTDYAHDVAVDRFGNVYLTGVTYSSDFPTVRPLQTDADGWNQPDAFVMKLSPRGQPVYSTYLGGSCCETNSPDDVALAVEVDRAGRAFVAGGTYAVDFPVTPGAHQTTNQGGADVFISKLSADGSRLIYSTLLGGYSADGPSDLAVDARGNAYVGGSTDSLNFPIFNAFQPRRTYGGDAFLTKIDPTGTSLVYSTYFGGDSFDSGRGVAVDGRGRAYLAGSTDSDDFPTKNPIQGYQGHHDGWVTKFSRDGTRLVWSTYVGGNETGNFYIDPLDEVWDVALDEAGNALLTGYTYSVDFPVVNAFQTDAPSDGMGPEGFVTKIDSTGSTFVYSSYLAGRSNDYGWSIAAGPEGAAYVVGSTTSSEGFPLVDPIDDHQSGGQAIFVSKVTAGGALAYSTYLGGETSQDPHFWAENEGEGVAVDAMGTAYVVGSTFTIDFPIVRGLQDSNAGVFDAVLAVISD